MIFNRNLHVAVLVAAMMALGARASLVTSNEVVDAVSAWASANGETFTDGNRAGTAVAATPTYDDDGTTVLYWTVTMSNGGAVIASPDTDLDLVIAFLEKHDGAFPEGHPLPAILKMDMKNRLAALAQRNATSAGGRRRAGSATTMQSATSSTGLDGAVASANRQWAKYGVGRGGVRLMADTLDGEDASPYVRRIVDGFEKDGRYTHWNQGKVDGRLVYNFYTPKHAVCGCVATAGAAILQFFNCTNDVGAVKGSPTYGQEMTPAGEFKNSFSNGQWTCNCTIPGPIDWSILPATSYGGTNVSMDVLNDECRELLGRVTYNLGVLVDMGWDLMGEGTSSGSNISALPEAFKTYGFKTARYVAYSSDPRTDGKEFFKTIFAQVWCGAPVALGIGNSAGGAGHAVVACGYARDGDGDEFCRVFMGWSGKDDAWYKLPAIKEFNIVDGATTMIGYQDDAVVPIYGESSMPGVELTLPGYVTNDVVVTVPVNENGFFGIRVPSTITEQTITYEPRGWSYTFTPWDASVLADEEKGIDELDPAIPDEIPAFLLHATMKPTIESGRAVAEREGKALLMVSGQPGTPRTKALMEYLYWLDDTTDFSNKYVLVFNNIKSSDLNRPDGNPGIGVFDPVDFEVCERWQDVNERLAYNAFIDFDASGETNEVVYTFSETNTVVMTNGVADVLAVGYDAYLRQHSGISLTVTGVHAASDTNAFEVATVVPTYGVYTNAWTNGEMIVLSAPGTITNDENTIISCVGWTTNEPFAYNPDTQKWELQPYNEGNEVSLQLFADDDIKLTWIWGVTHYRVTAEAIVPYGTEIEGSLVSPVESWVKVGGRATIVAEPSTGNGRVLNEWIVETDEKFPAEYEAMHENAMVYENGSSISFSVYEPVHVTVKYANGSDVPEAPQEWSFTLSASPAEMQDELPPPMGSTGPLAWGENTTYDIAVSLSPGAASYTDSTGGVWVCTGWIVNDEMATSDTDITYYTLGYEYVCVWELQEPESPEGPEPEAISIKSLEQTADGSWTVTVEGAVKDCWYWLYETDDLADFAGDEATWTAAVGLADTEEDNPQQATEDGDIVFRVTTDNDAQLFWRARATSTEDGN